MAGYNSLTPYLSDGAALFYTSVKEGKNCDLLYKYIVHRIYGFPFTAPALVVERDSVFMSVSSLSLCNCSVQTLSHGASSHVQD